MAKTRVSCPNCRQPVMADIKQLFDVGTDPNAKNELLTGAFNLIQCPNCGFRGNLSSPIVYHDPDKELLLTFVPAELGLRSDDQERLIGGLINQVVKNLPQEKRKGYLLRPQATLTMQGLIDRVLEGEGITREMLQAQQTRINLIQRLLTTSSADVRAEIAKQEDAIMDEQFFGLLRRLIEASSMSGDQQAAQQLNDLQESLLPLTTFGRSLLEQSKEVEAAVADLRAAGRGLTRDKLLDMLIQAPNEIRVNALVSFTRPLMDYQFFQTLSERIDKAKGEERNRLLSLRESLLQLTQEIDRQVEAQSKQARDLLNTILQADDIGEATLQNLPAVDEFFVEELNRTMEEARKTGDLDKLAKLQKVVDIFQQVSQSQTPPGAELIEDLLEAEDDAARMRLLEEHKDEITPDFISALSNIAAQVQQSGQEKELADRVTALHRMVLRFSMRQNLK